MKSVCLSVCRSNTVSEKAAEKTLMSIREIKEEGKKKKWLNREEYEERMMSADE